MLFQAWRVAVVIGGRSGPRNAQSQRREHHTDSRRVSVCNHHRSPVGQGWCFPLFHVSSPHKAWQAWGFMAYEAVGHFERIRGANKQAHLDTILHYADMAMQGCYSSLSPCVHDPFPGFFNAIALSSSASLQDTLRLLALWFKYGEHETIWKTLNAGVEKVNIDTWLPVRQCCSVTESLISPPGHPPVYCAHSHLETAHAPGHSRSSVRHRPTTSSGME